MAHIYRTDTKPVKIFTIVQEVRLIIRLILDNK